MGDMTDKIICDHCNGSGEIALKAWTLTYKCAGPVPEDARGVVVEECSWCHGTGEVEDQDDD